MTGKNLRAIIAAGFIFLAGIAGGTFFGHSLLTKNSNPKPVSEPTVAPAPSPTTDAKPLFVYDSTALMRSFNSWMIFSENFNASYKDPSFSGKYQLAYPLYFPQDTLMNSKFDNLMLSLLFGEKAPKTVNRKSIQSALEDIMKGHVKTTRTWWDEAKATYGKDWRNQVCGCSGYFYAMPTERTSQWMTFQKIWDYSCGGNSGPGESYYTIIMTEDPYVMDTTAFVPGFREKMVDMITDNVIYNYYMKDLNKKIERDEIRQATVNQFKGNFTPTLTLSGVKFLFSTWALPSTSHADGRIPVIVPLRIIQEIFTQKFKKDIGL